MIPSQIPKIVCDEIIKGHRHNTIDSLVDEQSPGANSKIRKSKVNWIMNDSWIAGMMAHFAMSANKNHFGFDINGFQRQIQFTQYAPGDFYTWHIDADPDLLCEPLTRKLSIVMCLSSKDDYEGGELEIAYPSQFKFTFKLDYGEVIIFPSVMQHRVRKLISGERFSLVGWMEGPRFK
tara:strand:+ start:107 stop:640 length:534 start_codon:yes stop_codon:yes gene_type:complete